jgi:hypothetical protein
MAAGKYFKLKIYCWCGSRVLPRCPSANSHPFAASPARRVFAMPMFRNVSSGAEPDPIVPAQMVEELDQPDHRAEADPGWKLFADILPTE